MPVKLPDIISNPVDDELSDSSGISVSGETDDPDRIFLTPKDKLRYIAQAHDRLRGSKNAQRCSPNTQRAPFLPRIEAKYAALEKENLMRTQYRLPTLPRSPVHLPAVPPTQGKYRHRVKVIPVLNLPSPDPQHPPSPPPAVHWLLREQYMKERNQQSPGFTEADLARIFDHYSLTRYICSRESRNETSRNTPAKSVGYVSTKAHLPSLIDIRKFTNAHKSKSTNLVWIPRLASWIPDQQSRPIQYIKFGAGANINVRRQPICCKYHDFFHKNLNWEAREWEPTICPRYSFHHYNQLRHGKKVTKATNPTLKNKRKPLTVPRDPFTSKEQRNIKRTWLKEPKKELPEETSYDESIHLVLPKEKDDASPYNWMVDTATMTEDTLSDLFSVHESIPPEPSRFSSPPPSDTASIPVQIKRRKVIMVDKACDAMSQSPIYSRRNSHFTEETNQTDMMDDILASPFTTSGEITITSPKQTPGCLDETVKYFPPGTPDKTSLLEKRLSDDFDDSAISLDRPASQQSYKAEEELEVVNGGEEVMDKIDLENNDSLLGGSTKLSNDNVPSLDSVSVFDSSADSTVDSYFVVVGSDSEDGGKTLSSKSSSTVQEKKIRPKPPPPKLRPVVVEPAHDSGMSTSHSDDDKSDVSTTTSSKNRPPIVIPMPTFLDRPNSPTSSKSGRSMIAINTPSPTPSQKSARRRGKVMRDMALTEEMRRARLAEERRKRAKEKFEKMRKSRNVPPSGAIATACETPEDGGFLDKFCIFNHNKMELFKRVFDTMDIDEDGLLDCEEVLEALERILPKDPMRESHMHYIYRLLEMTGYESQEGQVNFRLFSIIASLAQRIQSLDEFMRGLIDRFDFQSLDSKLWRARRFFEQYVDDHESQTMSLDSLWVELQAGGITKRHENQIRKSLQHLSHLDLLDFMTYLPLFTFTHSRVISNPLCDERVI